MSQEKISLSESNQQPGEPAYKVPTDAVPLPSKGIVYPVDHPFHGVERVEIRSMTARDEDILTSAALLRQGKAISALVRSCMINKAVDPDKLLVGDRNAILVAIRITGYGSDYKVDVVCPSCEGKSKFNFDLSSLPIKTIGADPVVLAENKFTFKLPMSGRSVTFRLPTGEDDRELTQIAERSKKAGVESLVTTRLTHLMVSVDGDDDRGKIAQFVRSMPARDSRELRTFIDKINPGIDLRQTFSCPSCGHEEEVDVPLGTEFFWPSE